MPMPTPDPYTYLQEVAVRLPKMTERSEIETALDEVEYLFDVLPPEMQDPAYELIEQLRVKLQNATS
jgi:hypothetical protein